MPIYEYHCEQCSKDFECLVMGSDSPSCPDCKGDRIHRLMSACGFLSKGGGGETTGSSAGSSCGGCSASSCGGCGHGWDASAH